MSAHPLDEWVGSLVEVRHEGIRAWVDRAADPWDEAPPEPRVLVLRRSLWRPELAELAEYCSDWDLDVWTWEEEEWGEAVADEEVALARHAWTAPDAEILAGSALALVPSEELFSFWALWDDSPCSSSDGFSAQALTRDRAVLGRSTEYSQFCPTAIGLIDAKDAVRSAALLLYETLDPPEQTDWFSPYAESRPSDIGFGGLSKAQALRLIVARDSMRSRRFITMPDDQLVAEVRAATSCDEEEPGEESAAVKAFLALFD